MRISEERLARYFKGYGFTPLERREAMLDLRDARAEIAPLIEATRGIQRYPATASFVMVPWPVIDAIQSALRAIEGEHDNRGRVACSKCGVDVGQRDDYAQFMERTMKCKALCDKCISAGEPDADARGLES